MKKAIIFLSMALCVFLPTHLIVNGQKKTTAPKKTPSKTVVKPTQTAQKTPVNTNLPKVTQIDELALADLLKSKGKLLLVNFWATWCDPCREEFPELIKISQDFKDKLNFITISWDDLAEINRDVPKFLAQVKADNIPHYLLKTDNEDAVIRSISKDWVGGLPFTIMYNEKGEVIFTRMGKIKVDVLRAEIEKHLTQTSNNFTNQFLFHSEEDYEKGKIDAESDISNGLLFIPIGGRLNNISIIYTQILNERYGIQARSFGCVISGKQLSYIRGYKEISIAEIERRFGKGVLEKVRAESEELGKNNPPVINDLTLTVIPKP